jgi:hypothetical protein
LNSDYAPTIFTIGFELVKALCNTSFEFRLCPYKTNIFQVLPPPSKLVVPPPIASAHLSLTLNQIIKSNHQIKLVARSPLINSQSNQICSGLTADRSLIALTARYDE